MRIAANYSSDTSFTVATDRAAEFAVGVRVQADCGADGTVLGTVTASSYASGPDLTTVGLSPDAGTLTANLTGVLHGNDTPESLANHGHTGPADGGLVAMSALTAMIAALPGHYSRDQQWTAKTVVVAADRYTLLSPNRLAVDVGGALLWLATQQSLDLSVAATWDSTTTDYTVAANRAGKDFYVYACNNSGSLTLLVSTNSTSPAGYTATTSRQLGGFHCLCADVGAISGHALSGYVAGDILPASIWDLRHRPVSAPEGMVYVAGIGKWADIYLASVADGKLVSVFGGTCASGASSPLFDWYDFTEWFGRIGKVLPGQGEFMAAATGSNEGTNIDSAAAPVTTGGHVDTESRRIISDVGCEDCNGTMFQWGSESGGPYAGDSFVSQATTRSSQQGSAYNLPNKVAFGSYWKNATNCGTRAASWHNGPLLLANSIGARGFADAIRIF